MEKVLIISPWYSSTIGGVETFAENLVEELSKKYIVDIATLAYNKPWQGQNNKEALKIAWRLLPIVVRHTKYIKYDKVYCLGLISSAIARVLRLKYSSIILALYDFKKPNFKVKWALGKAEKIFVEGFGGAEDIYNAGVPANNVVKFQHWVNKRFEPISRDIRPPNDILKVLFVGRPIKIKGRSIIKGVEEILRERIRFIYVENVAYKYLPKYYQAADICVVPSLYSEGFSRVVAEAMSCGCIVIASNKGSLPEMIGKGGYCMEPTVDNYVRYIESFNFDRKQLEQSRQEAIKYAQEHFSPKNAGVFL